LEAPAASKGFPRLRVLGAGDRRGFSDGCSTTVTVVEPHHQNRDTGYFVSGRCTLVPLAGLVFFLVNSGRSP